MVGGNVIEVIVLDSKVWINCKDGKETCAIYVEKTPEALQVKPDDMFWWQGKYAYWTKNDRSVNDYPIPRRGFSGVARPKGY